VCNITYDKLELKQQREYNATVHLPFNIIDFESIDIGSNFYSLGTTQNMNNEYLDSTKFNNIYSGNLCNDLKIFHLNNDPFHEIIIHYLHI